MASEYQRLNFDRTENTTTAMGHDIIWHLSVPDLAHIQPRPFNKFFKTNCKNNPTLWRFEMSLAVVRDDGTCSMSVMLKRLDTLNVELEGVVWIDICDSNDGLIFRKQTFNSTGMVHGDFIQETVEMTPLPNMQDAIHQNPTVVVTLMICFCHDDFESD